MLKNNYTKMYIEQGLNYVTYRNVGTKNYCSIRNLSLGYKDIFFLCTFLNFSKFLKNNKHISFIIGKTNKQKTHKESTL